MKDREQADDKPADYAREDQGAGGQDLRNRLKNVGDLDVLTAIWWRNECLRERLRRVRNFWGLGDAK